MAELVQTVPPAQATEAGQRDRSYLWRRLHSLSGLVPVGAYLVFHLYENMAAIGGEQAYNSGIAHLISLLPSPYFYAVEVGLIIVPIAFHGFYGAYLALQSRPNLGSFPYRRNYLYVAQRVSGIVALVYLAYHVIALRVAITLVNAGGKVPGFGAIEGHPGYVSYGDMVHHFSNPVLVGWYVAGTLACAFHFANGFNGLAWTWGIAVTERARRVVEGISWAAFVLLSLPFLHILYSFWMAGQG